MAQGTAEKVFRLDNEVLAFRFTMTRSERAGEPTERLSSPARLALWLEANGLRFDDVEPTEADLRAAITLRETIYRAGSAIARRTAPDHDDVKRLNEASRKGRAHVSIEPGGARLVSTSGHPVRDALGVIAQDAIGSIAGSYVDLVSLCDDPDCRGLFLDMSPATNRRWCSMNTCGNRAKKAAMAARRAEREPATL